MPTQSEYEEIFGKDFMANLATKSGESLAKFKRSLGDENKDLQTHQEELLATLTAAEEGYIPKLEKAAVALVKELYPLIDEYGIEIDAHIVPFKGDVRTYTVAYNAVKNKFKNIQEAFGDKEEKEEPDREQEMKRRILNSLQHAEALRGAYGFLFFKKHLSDINGLAPGIIDNYKKALDATFAAYDDDDGVAQMMNFYGNNPNALKGGESRAIKRNGKTIIQAVAMNFPMLVHEIIKGYESINIGWKGRSSKSKEKNQAVINKVDKLTNEPEDIRWGKFFMAGLKNLYIESGIDDPRVGHTFEQEIAKLKYPDLKSLIVNAVEKKITSEQKTWIDSTLMNLEERWRQHDFKKALKQRRDKGL
jgi:hypothetical protein